MKKKLAVLAVLIALAVTSAFGQIPFFGGLPVFDASNLANAIKRHFELVRQYEQLVIEYEQLVLEYEHFLWMAKQLPGLPRHKLSFTPWRFSSSTNIYGTSGGDLGRVVEQRDRASSGTTGWAFADHVDGALVTDPLGAETLFGFDTQSTVAALDSVESRRRAAESRLMSTTSTVPF